MSRLFASVALVNERCRSFEVMGIQGGHQPVYNFTHGFRPLIAVRVLFDLSQHVGGIPVAQRRQPPQLIQVTLLAGRFHELVRCVPAAGISKPPEFGQIPALGGTFNQFIRGVRITVLRTLPQRLEFRFSGAFRIRCLHASTMGAALVHVQSNQYRKMSTHSRLWAWMSTRNNTKSNSRCTLTM
ncbi:MAG: hypothetical protein JWQ56_4153 [Pseudarthrobacter sp.]|nr:hypothetical protein [Pseudarthrobacter sp.]